MNGTLGEHHGYLSDSRRIAAFERAIARSVRPGDVVVDLGCGFGVLGQMCLQAGASRVYGIESTDAIDIARETATRAGLADRYICVRGRSFEVELPERADVLICDHVGYFGIDYGIVELLADARHRFLKPGGRMLPETVSLRLAAVRSADLRGRLKAWDDPGLPAQYRWLGDHAVNTKHAVDLPCDAIVSPAATGASLALRDPLPATVVASATLVADRAGAVDGIGGWFACALSGGVEMTNAPGDPGRIDRHQVFLGIATPVEVEAGDEIEVTVRVRHAEPVIAWSVFVPRTGERARHSTWASMPLGRGARSGAGSCAGSCADEAPRTLNRRGRATLAVLDAVDGERGSAAVEEAVVAGHPDLFPDDAQLRRFVRRELARSAR